MATGWRKWEELRLDISLALHVQPLLTLHIIAIDMMVQRYLYIQVAPILLLPLKISVNFYN